MGSIETPANFTSCSERSFHNAAKDLDGRKPYKLNQITCAVGGRAQPCTRKMARTPFCEV